MRLLSESRRQRTRTLPYMQRGGGGGLLQRIAVILMFLVSVQQSHHFWNIQEYYMRDENPLLFNIVSPSTTIERTSFDVSNPVWPLRPPETSNDCAISFRNNDMSLCHITPWPNFGDELGPPIVKRILELHFACSADHLSVFDFKRIYQGGGEYGFLNRTGSDLRTCLLVVGSLWRMVKSGDHIWGTGAAYDGTIKGRCRPKPDLESRKVDNVTVYSSRGPLSAKDIIDSCTYNSVGDSSGAIENAGDAGFLVPFLFPELMRTKPRDTENPLKCVIPHKADMKRKGEWSDVKVTQLTVDIGWVNMTRRLQECDEVVSSSLHGVILSEALGIPNRRMTLSNAPGNFKFRDFYSSYRGSEPKIVRSHSEAFDDMQQPLPYNDREAYAKKVLKTFPIHLFHAVNASTGG